MKILVTGVAGFLGSHLAEALQKQGHQVIGIDNLIGGYEENVPQHVPWIKMNLNDPRLLGFLKLQKPEVIYHCACTPYEGLSVFSPALIVRNTFQNTANLLSAAIQAGTMKRFIYLSSMSRYGAQQAPFTEDMIPMPEDPYATAKVASEQLTKQLAETHGFEYVIAVPHSIIGTRQKYDDPYRNVASIMINRMLQGKPPIIYGDGSQTRCFSFIDDCLSSLLRLIDCPSGEIYNIGPDDKDGEVVSILELFEEIAYLIGFEDKPVFYPDRPREVKHAFCSSEKIRRDFGYKTKVSLIEGLDAMIEDIQRKGTKPFDYSLPVEIINDKTPEPWKKKLF